MYHKTINKKIFTSYITLTDIMPIYSLIDFTNVCFGFSLERLIHLHPDSAYSSIQNLLIHSKVASKAETGKLVTYESGYVSAFHSYEPVRGSPREIPLAARRILVGNQHLHLNQVQ
jgi:hypothetical protein